MVREEQQGEGEKTNGHASPLPDQRAEGEDVKGAEANEATQSVEEAASGDATTEAPQKYSATTESQMQIGTKSQEEPSAEVAAQDTQPHAPQEPSTNGGAAPETDTEAEVDAPPASLSNEDHVDDLLRTTPSISEMVVPISDGQGGLIVPAEPVGSEPHIERVAFPESSESRQNGHSHDRGTENGDGAAAESSTHRQPSQSDVLLPEISRLAREIVRNGEEKLAVAIGAYNAVSLAFFTHLAGLC